MAYIQKMGLRYWWEYWDEKALVDTVGYHKSVKNPKRSQAHQFHDYYKACEVQTAEPPPSGLCYPPLEKPSLGHSLNVLSTVAIIAR